MSRKNKVDREWDEWENHLNTLYEQKAADLITQGYTRQESDSPLVNESFVRDGQRFRLVRQLGSTEWYLVEI